MENKRSLIKVWLTSGLAFAVLAVTFTFCFSSWQYKADQYYTTDSNQPAVPNTDQISDSVAGPTGPSSGLKGTETPPVETVVPKSTKKTIAAAPPKQTTPTTPIIENTKKNSDGSTTTVVSTGGGVTDADISNTTAPSTTTISKPEDIPYIDETGLYPELGATLEIYLDKSLLWHNEISSLKSISLRDAGATGWSGQYLGSYTVSADGTKITGATGSIILNAYYYKNSSLFTDYMKLVLSHEYGHHYTLWHKWVDWNLPISSRFPDSYYSTRPLSKTTTATDYSFGWANCEAEIIAEDYSYLFSGYAYDGVANIYGYPSSAMKSWLQNIGSADLLKPPVAPSFSVSISSPTESATLNGDAVFAATTANGTTSKVDFYVGDNLVAEDTTAPYSATIHTATFANGSYILKAVAFSGDISTNQTVNVAFQNSVVDLIKPTISILSPTTNPYNLTGGSLEVTLTADDLNFSKIELYKNDILTQTWTSKTVDTTINFSTTGTYNLRFRAYDQAGNYTEITLAISKSS
ncbi:MAG: Ig-like domain-containing protein [Candidatus Berkelbacteria bacterium]|nr:Ig-like domain-containing protein [Candidatus Berkelbacteria bacterium]